jgi:radical SAM protein with 4Fe4S-binding SPASM domain
MLWGEKGVCNDNSACSTGEELDWKVIEKIFAQTSSYHPSFILSGGEPLLYSRFDDLAKLCKERRCFAYVCTNGTLLNRFTDTADNNPYLVYYVSIDGTRQINDMLRGDGVYDTVTQNIKTIKSLKRPPYIGIQFTLQKENVSALYDTCREMVRLGVDWILINLRWYITDEQVREYEEVMQQRFHVSPWSHDGYNVRYALDKEEFVKQCLKIKSEKWPIQISSYLKDPQDIYAYVDEPRVCQYNAFCYKQWIRMDVMPDGNVTPCIPYPDLIVGNLGEKSVMEVWNSPEFAGFRDFIRKNQLPVCSKCYALYLYDKARMLL